MQFQCTCELPKLVPAQATNNSQFFTCLVPFEAALSPGMLSLEWQSLTLYSSPRLTLCFCVLKCSRQITASASSFQKAERYMLGYLCLSRGNGRYVCMYFLSSLSQLWFGYEDNSQGWSFVLEGSKSESFTRCCGFRIMNVNCGRDTEWLVQWPLFLWLWGTVRHPPKLWAHGRGGEVID